MATRKKDVNQTVARQVARITKTKLPKGEDLLGDPELKRQFAEAKKKRR